MNGAMEGFVLAVVIGMLAAEWVVSMRHERWLRAHGAVEPPGDPYRALAIVYPAAFVLMGLEGLWRAGGDAGAGGGPAWGVSGALLFLAGKGLKYWAIGHLRERWTFKVLVVPGLPLVRSGPYRYVDHPNYIAIVGELAGMALMVHAWWTGPVMTALFLLVLRRRLRVEVEALRT